MGESKIDRFSIKAENPYTKFNTWQLNNYTNMPKLTKYRQNSFAFLKQDKIRHQMTQRKLNSLVYRCNRNRYNKSTSGKSHYKCSSN